jgi:hypothetical protein
MQPVGSLPCSQQPAIGPYPEPDESTPHTPCLCYILIVSSTTVWYQNCILLHMVTHPEDGNCRNFEKSTAFDAAYPRKSKFSILICYLGCKYLQYAMCSVFIFRSNCVRWKPALNVKLRAL